MEKNAPTFFPSLAGGPAGRPLPARHRRRRRRDDARHLPAGGLGRAGAARPARRRSALRRVLEVRVLARLEARRHRPGRQPAPGVHAVLAEARPRFFILENVYALTFDNKASKPAFTRLLKEIDAAGYQFNWQVLNAGRLRRSAGYAPACSSSAPAEATRLPELPRADSPRTMGAPARSRAARSHMSPPARRSTGLDDRTRAGGGRPRADGVTCSPRSRLATTTSLHRRAWSSEPRLRVAVPVLVVPAQARPRPTVRRPSRRSRGPTSVRSIGTTGGFGFPSFAGSSRSPTTSRSSAGGSRSRRRSATRCPPLLAQRVAEQRRRSALSDRHRTQFVERPRPALVDPLHRLRSGVGSSATAPDPSSSGTGTPTRRSPRTGRRRGRRTDRTCT